MFPGEKKPRKIPWMEDFDKRKRVATDLWAHGRQRLRRRDYQHNLAFGRMSLVVRQQFTRGAAVKFLELFGELPRDAELPVGHDVETSGERFGQSVGRFEEDGCFFALSSAA